MFDCKMLFSVDIKTKTSTDFRVSRTYYSYKTGFDLHVENYSNNGVK